LPFTIKNEINTKLNSINATYTTTNATSAVEQTNNKLTTLKSSLSPVYSDNSTGRLVELSCVAINGA